MNKNDDDIQRVANFKSKSERLSWKRKQIKIEKIIDTELKPIQDEILRLNEEKQPIMDKISKVREEMVKTCVHPKEYLEHHDTYVECKFCYNKLKLSELNQ